MFHRSSLLSNFVFITLVSFAACKPQLNRQRREGETTVTALKDGDLVQCAEGFDINKRWKKECNTCFCLNVGEEACTDRECPTPVASPVIALTIQETKLEADPRCSNGTQTVSWKRDCNTCFCVSNPPVVACTLALCPGHEATTEIPSEIST